MKTRTYKVQIDDRGHKKNINTIKRASKSIEKNIKTLESLGLKVKFKVDFNGYMDKNFKVKKCKNKTVYVI